jgi:putative Mg2+ transporter-C (MgtC) family protein
VVPAGAFDLPTFAEAASVTLRLVVAALLGGALGFERQIDRKPAGLRTHMLVSLGAALFVLASLEAGATASDLSRVAQGIATGIGFVGAGAIIKGADEGEVKGLTTAAGIWLTAAVGMAVGTGRLWLSGIGVVLALVILSVLRRVEAYLDAVIPAGRSGRRGSQAGSSSGR